MSLEGLLGSMSLQILRCRHSSIDIFYLQLLSIKCQKAWPFNDAKINIVFTASKHFLFLHPCILHLWAFGTSIRIAQDHTCHIAFYMVYWLPSYSWDLEEPPLYEIHLCHWCIYCYIEAQKQFLKENQSNYSDFQFDGK